MRAPRTLSASSWVPKASNCSEWPLLPGRSLQIFKNLKVQGYTCKARCDFKPGFYCLSPYELPHMIPCRTYVRSSGRVATPDGGNAELWDDSLWRAMLYCDLKPPDRDRSIPLPTIHKTCGPTLHPMGPRAQGPMRPWARRPMGQSAQDFESNGRGAGDRGQLGASTRCVNSVRQVGASTRCVSSLRQLGASTPSTNSVLLH